jgi:hypothetical protein
MVQSAPGRRKEYSGNRKKFAANGMARVIPKMNASRRETSRTTPDVFLAKVPWGSDKCLKLRGLQNLSVYPD